MIDGNQLFLIFIIKYLFINKNFKYSQHSKQTFVPKVSVNKIKKKMCHLKKIFNRNILQHNFILVLNFSPQTKTSFYPYSYKYYPYAFRIYPFKCRLSEVCGLRRRIP